MAPSVDKPAGPQPPLPPANPDPFPPPQAFPPPQNQGTFAPQDLGRFAPPPYYGPPASPQDYGPFAPPAAFPVSDEALFHDPGSEKALEDTLRLIAIPAALLGAWLLMHTSSGRSLGRIFFSMWVHELGHSVAAWFCGFHAVPLPWFTPVADNRSIINTAMLAAPLVYFGHRAWNAKSRPLIAAAGALLLLQLVCTFVLSIPSARAFFIFGGDAGCLVFGTALILTFFAPAESKLRRHHLRWGFLVIGAVSFMDVFEGWWAARHDSDRIAYGTHELAGLSDASKLTETFGWTESQMVRAYVVLGVVCLLVMAAVYARAVWKPEWLRSVRRALGKGA